MQKPKVYSLSGLKRFFQYPYPIRSIGWMPHHLHMHNNACLSFGYICISGNWENRFSSRYVNGKLFRSVLLSSDFFSFGILSPGTRLHTVLGTYHDELFFEYDPEVFERLIKMLSGSDRKIDNFRFRTLPLDTVIGIRKVLQDLDKPGMADKADQLAVTLFTEIITNHLSGTSASYNRNSLKLYAIATEIGKGKDIPSLLKEFGMSERSFYREWSNCFSLSPAKYRAREQIRQACYLLKNTGMTHEEIRLQCGFATLNYFYQKFKQTVGMSPRDFRQTNTSVLLPEDDNFEL